MGSSSSRLSVNERMAILESARVEAKLNKLDNLMAQNLMVSASPALIEQMQDLRMKSFVEAIRKDAVKEVQRILKEGKVAIDQEFGPLKVTLLHMAVYYGSVGTIQFLMKVPGTQVNAPTSEGDTPVVLAVLSSESDLQALKLAHLLTQDSHISVLSKNVAKIPAVAALKKGFVDTARLLLSNRFIQSYSLDQLVLISKMALRFHHDDVLQSIFAGLKPETLERIIQQIRPKTAVDDICNSLEGLALDVDKLAAKGSEDPSEKWSEDAGDNKLRIGNHVQTLSKETVKRFLPPNSKDSDIVKIAGQKAIIHNIIGESLYIELIDANCMAAINSRAVIFSSKGNSCTLADESLATVGSFVRVIENGDMLKTVQGETRWRHGMEETCGRTGRVVRISEEGLVQVQFAWGCRFFYSPKALLASNEDRIDSQDSQGQWFQTESAAMVEPNPNKFRSLQEEIGLQADGGIAGKLVQVDKISIKPFSGQQIVRILGNGQVFSVNSQALQIVTQELDSAGNRIAKGDSVKLRPDSSKVLPSLQTPPFGGFVERMLQLGNVQGTVESIIVDGRYNAPNATVKVRFTTEVLYHMNPKALLLLERGTGKIGASKGQLEVIKRTQLKCMDKLGEGGFGSVYKGTWAMENGKVKTVAIKQMNYGVTSSNVFEDILKEAKTQFALNHPNVISIYGISYGPKQDLWLVMKLVEGRDLNSILFPAPGEKKFELPFKYKVKICMDVAYAIAFIHDKGYLHSDIKPNNMMVNMRTGRVYVCDFGITRYLGNMDLHAYATNYTDNFGGTLLYVAPECLKQDKDKRYLRPTFKSDVWSLGASFYELFAERYLFDDGMVCFKCKVQNDSEYVQKLVSFNVPQEVRTIIKKMLDFLPSRRPNVYELTDLLHSLKE